jgi:hypothetical protein
MSRRTMEDAVIVLPVRFDSARAIRSSALRSWVSRCNDVRFIVMRLYASYVITKVITMSSRIDIRVMGPVRVYACARRIAAVR